MELLPRLFLRAQSVLFNPVRTVFKSDLPFRWKRPGKPAFYAPSRTGDRVSYENRDRTNLCKKYEISEELKDADEDVKKIFTLDYHGLQQLKISYQAETEDLVRRHDLDAGSLEVMIAKHTADIRFLQDYLPKLRRRNGAMNTKMNLLIHRRQKLLSKLRHRDYKKFEWLIEKLQIVFKPWPKVDVQVGRKEGLRRLTQIHCDDIKAQRLAEYRNQLESQQEEFLKKKMENLNFIRDEQKGLGIEVTVSQKDIDICNEKYLALKAKREEEEKTTDRSRKWKMY